MCVCVCACMRVCVCVCTRVRAYVFACVFTSTQTVHAAERHEYARRSRASEEVMRDRMSESKSLLDEERLSKKELSYGQFDPITPAAVLVLCRTDQPYCLQLTWFGVGPVNLLTLSHPMTPPRAHKGMSARMSAGHTLVPLCALAPHRCHGLPIRPKNLYGDFSTTLVHSFCFFRLFLMGGKELMCFIKEDQQCLSLSLSACSCTAVTNRECHSQA